MVVGRMLLCFAVAGDLWGQGVRPPVRRPPVDTRPVKEGCPAVVPPSDGSTVATATDFIELKRTACAEGCPAYTVRIGGDGRVAWVGERFVEMKGSAAAGIDVIKARELMQRIAGQGFGMFCARYSQGASDGATTFITLSIAGKSKRVQDTGRAAPPLLRTIADDIDRVGDTHKWRHGEPMQETFGDDRLVVDLVSPKNGVTRLMRVAGASNTSELADMVADTSMDLNAVDSSGWTALMYAAQAGTSEAVAILLKGRARAELRSYEGETAMFAAASSMEHPDVKVRMLAAVGVDVNGQDNRGVTPLMIAARHSRMGGLISSLMALGADPAKRDVEGKTALDYLAEAEVEVGARDSVARGLLARK
jgi:Domain of unknown function (DUF6438)/Ankyrin repeats (3 copies)/Ankyrin repeat